MSEPMWPADLVESAELPFFWQYRDSIPEGEPPNDPVKLAVALEARRLGEVYASQYPRGFWARLAWLIRGDLPLSWRRQARRMLKSNPSKQDREIDRGLAARLAATGLRGK